MSKLVISEDLREMYDLPFGDNSRAFPFSTARALIERISRAEATLASRNSMLDRLNASNERLTAENEALREYSKLCETHTSDCERGHLKSATCVRCLLTLATNLRCKAEAERDALKLKLQRVEAHREWLLEGYRKIAHGEPLSEQYARDTLSGPTDATIDRIIAVRADKE